MPAKPASAAKRTNRGATNLVGNSIVVGGVTSLALNGSYGDTGGVFRMDRANVLSFINSFIAAHL